MERVMLTVPAELLAEVDALARRTGRKRSQVVRLALRELLERRRREEFEALLAAGYQELAAEAATAAAESLPLQAAAAEGIWRWGDSPPGEGGRPGDG
jgi:metal-responsive CopG/Arc/MetJ family transcriptional regulator